MDGAASLSLDSVSFSGTTRSAGFHCGVRREMIIRGTTSRCQLVIRLVDDQIHCRAVAEGTRGASHNDHASNGSAAGAIPAYATVADAAA